jgi:hypothetical protein
MLFQRGRLYGNGTHNTKKEIDIYTLYSKPNAKHPLFYRRGVWVWESNHSHPITFFINFCNVLKA